MIFFIYWNWIFIVIILFNIGKITSTHQYIKFLWSIAALLWVNIVSGNSLLPDSSKISPEPILTPHHICIWHNSDFTPKFSEPNPWYVFRDYTFKIATTSPRVNELTYTKKHNKTRQNANHVYPTHCHMLMMTSSNGDFFRVTGPLCATRPVTWSFDVSFDLRLSKQSWAGDLRRHRAHYYVTVVVTIYCTTDYLFNIPCSISGGWDAKGQTSLLCIILLGLYSLPWIDHLPPVWHYCDVIMGAMPSQITSLMIVYLIVQSGAGQRKHQSSASLAFCAGNSPVIG